MKVSPIDRYGTALLVGYVLLQVLLVMPHWHRDLAGFYLAAQAYWSGQTGLIYAAPEHFFGGTPDPWLAALEPYRAEFAEPDAFPFVYPPLWAALFSPLAGALSLTAFSNLIFVVQALLLVASVRLGWSLSGRKIPWPRWAALSTFILAPSAAAATAFDLNQLQITLTFLTLLTFERLTAGKSAPAGVLLAVVTAVKLTPAVLAVIFVLRRDWKALGTFLATLAALALASVLFGGADLTADYLAQLHRASANLILTAINFSATPLMHLGLVTQPDIIGQVETYGYVAVEPRWIAGVSLALMLIMSGLACIAVRRPTTPAKVASLLAALSIAIAFAGPLGWAHYYLVPTLLLPMLLGSAPTCARSVLLVGLTVGVSMALVKTLSLSPAPLFALLIPSASYLIAFVLFLRRPKRET